MLLIQLDWLHNEAAVFDVGNSFRLSNKISAGSLYAYKDSSVLAWPPRLPSPNKTKFPHRLLTRSMKFVLVAALAGLVAAQDYGGGAPQGSTPPATSTAPALPTATSSNQHIVRYFLLHSLPPFLTSSIRSKSVVEPLLHSAPPVLRLP